MAEKAPEPCCQGPVEHGQHQGELLATLREPQSLGLWNTGSKKDLPLKGNSVWSSMEQGSQSPALTHKCKSRTRPEPTCLSVASPPPQARGTHPSSAVPCPPKQLFFLSVTLGRTKGGRQDKGLFCLHQLGKPEWRKPTFKVVQDLSPSPGSLEAEEQDETGKSP